MELCSVKDGYYIWKKGELKKIGDYFNTKEFSCQCKHDDCVDQKVSEELIKRLSTIRYRKQSPMTITSGLRCKKHQEDIRNSGVSTVVAKVSQHELGNAADAQFKSLRIDEWINDAKLYFSYVGIATNFLHMDTRPAKEPGVIVTWKY